MFRILTRKPEEILEKDNIINEIRELSKSLALAYERYDYIVDDDLIEASIYEIESLKSRYKYMLNLAKEKGILADVTKSAKTISYYSEETIAS